MKIWAKTKEWPEGKYLVVRRDGTVPRWPHFVLGGDDPSAPAALRAYACDAWSRGLDPEYCRSITELAAEFEVRSGGKPDPDAPPHRTDNPAVLAMMRGEADLFLYRGGFEAARPKVVCFVSEAIFHAGRADFERAETLAGNIVLSTGGVDNIIFSDDRQAELDALQLRRIDLADELIVIKTDLGDEDCFAEKTLREIKYAESRKKSVRYTGGKEN